MAPPPAAPSILPKSGGAIAPLAPPLLTPLNYIFDLSSGQNRPHIFWTNTDSVKIQPISLSYHIAVELTLQKFRTIIHLVSYAVSSLTYFEISTNLKSIYCLVKNLEQKFFNWHNRIFFSMFHPQNSQEINRLDKNNLPSNFFLAKKIFLQKCLFMSDACTGTDRSSSYSLWDS